MNPVLVSAPAELPVSLSMLKEHLRVTHAEQDALLEQYLSGAVARIDGAYGHLGRALVTQDWAVSMPAFATAIRLPIEPVQSIVSVTYRDKDGVEQTVDPAGYVVSSDPLGTEVRPASGQTWPSDLASRPDAVTVTFRAGYGAPGDVPDDIKNALMLKVQARYSKDSDAEEIADDLLHRYRRYRVAHGY